MISSIQNGDLYGRHFLFSEGEYLRAVAVYGVGGAFDEGITVKHIGGVRTCKGKRNDGVPCAVFDGVITCGEGFWGIIYGICDIAYLSIDRTAGN